MTVEEALAQLADAIQQREHDEAVEELRRINEILREAGFEYPTGSRGVADLAMMWQLRDEP